MQASAINERPRAAISDSRIVMVTVVPFRVEKARIRRPLLTNREGYAHPSRSKMKIRIGKRRRSNSLSPTSLRQPFGFRNVNHRQRTTIPRPAAAADIPGDVDLVALRIDGGAERAHRRGADV